MKTLLSAGLVSLAITLAASAAHAGHRHHGHHGYHGYHHNYGDELLIAGGIIGGAILLGHLLAPRPVYQVRPYYPPTVYYAPPPPPVYYAPPPRTCIQDRVYRHLPDGRIQWGTRTTCY